MELSPPPSGVPFSREPTRSRPSPRHPWSWQWEWEDYLRAPVDETFGGVDTPAEMELVTVSLRDQVVRLRNHPSVVVWNLASDMLPHPDLERKYRALLAEIDPTRPPLAACSVRTSEVSGPSGVKMSGP